MKHYKKKFKDHYFIMMGVNASVILLQDKDTPLHLAASSKCPQCVALLLNAGAVSTVEVKNEVWKNCH